MITRLGSVTSFGFEGSSNLGSTNFDAPVVTGWICIFEVSSAARQFHCDPLPGGQRPLAGSCSGTRAQVGWILRRSRRLRAADSMLHPPDQVMRPDGVDDIVAVLKFSVANGEVSGVRRACCLSVQEIIRRGVGSSPTPLSRCLPSSSTPKARKASCHSLSKRLMSPDAHSHTSINTQTRESTPASSHSLETAFYP